MQEKSKNFIRDHIAELKKRIGSENAKNALSYDPSLPARIKLIDEANIRKLVAGLREYRDKLLPYVKQLRQHIHEITEETCICACYLLAAQIFKLWKAILFLGDKAHYTAIMILIRAIKEHNMLISLLASEYQEGKDDNLKKWFSGDIVSHAEGRKKMTSMLNSDPMFSDIGAEKINSFITNLYVMESFYAHPTYASVLENINPFVLDFDFDQYTGTHRTVSALEYGPMVNTNIALKSIFGFVLRESKVYSELSEILKKYQPNIDLNEGITRLKQ